MPHRTITPAARRHGPTKPSRVRMVSGQPTSAASSASGRTAAGARSSWPPAARAPRRQHVDRRSRRSRQLRRPSGRRYRPVRGDQLGMRAALHHARRRPAPGCGRRRSRWTAGAPGSAWCARPSAGPAPAGSPPHSRHRPRTAPRPAPGSASRAAAPGRSRCAGAGRRKSCAPRSPITRLVAVRQRHDEVVRVGGAGRGDHRPPRSHRAGRAADCPPTVPWNSVVSCATTAIMRRTASGSSVRRSCPPMRTAPLCGSYSRSSSRRIEDLPDAAGPDDADALARARCAKLRPGMRRAAAAGIGEADVLELDLRRAAPPSARRPRRTGASLRCLQQRVDAAFAADCPFMPGVQHGAQIAQRAENLGARHQHDQQRLAGSFRRGSTRHAPSARAAAAPIAVPRSVKNRGQQSQRQHPERAVRQRPRALRQHSPQTRGSGRTPSASAGPAPRRGTPRRTP